MQKDINIIHNRNSFFDSRDYKVLDEQPLMSKVFVNPNYTRRKSVIHINPRAQVRPSIYVNPKLIKNITCNPNQEETSESNIQIQFPFMHENSPRKCSVHVNPKLMTKLVYQIPEVSKVVQYKSYDVNSEIDGISIESSNSCVSINSQSALLPIKNKLYIMNGDCFPKKLSTNYTIQSKTKLITNNSALKKTSNSNFVALSQKKLVRITKSPKITAISASLPKCITPFRKRLSSSGHRKLRNSSKNNSSIIQLKKINDLKLISNTDKYKTNWNHQVNKNLLNQSYKKKLVVPKILLKNSISFVSIGGIMYKTSRNQMIRSNTNISPIKRCRSLTCNKHIQFNITKNGKKLLNLESNKKRIYSINARWNTSSSPIKNCKVTASNKVKQRSLQILRNKMRKNNQPCLLFQKFGYCANLLKGTCPKVHDKKQVALCRNFLQGKCLLGSCPLSHDAGPQKMPTCKYFLEGCCNRDGCPYLHVKVSSTNPICVEFLRGYCSEGQMCSKRHINVCPEFDKSGKCTKGKSCPYPHKSQLYEIKRFKGNVLHKNITMDVSQFKKTHIMSPSLECRKRYYNELTEDLSTKKEKLSRKIKLVNKPHLSQLNEFCEEKYIDFEKGHIKNIAFSKLNEENIQTVSCIVKRSLIGTLPSYIPIE